MPTGPSAAVIIPRFIIIASILLPGIGNAETWHVPGDAPTIQAGISLAQEGDDVLVAPGVYSERGIALKGAVRVHSEQGASATILDAGGASRGFDCLDQHEPTTLEGFTIRNGQASGDTSHERSGGGVRCMNSSLILRDCLITDCFATWHGGGVYAWNSTLTIEKCEVSGCMADFNGGGISAWCWGSMVSLADSKIVDNVARTSDGGIYAGADVLEITRCVVSRNAAGWGVAGGIAVSQTARFAVRDCVIAQNGAFDGGQAGGLGIVESTGSIENCTISDNGGVPPPNGLDVVDSVVRIERTIISFSAGMGLGCWDNSAVELQCCDFFGNDGGSTICGSDLGGNFSADPLFCDPEAGDYTLDGESPCLPGNHPDGVDCGLIGALGQGCGATAIEETTWGRLKSLYRSP